MQFLQYINKLEKKKFLFLLFLFTAALYFDFPPFLMTITMPTSLQRLYKPMSIWQGIYRAKTLVRANFLYIMPYLSSPIQFHMKWVMY